MARPNPPSPSLDSVASLEADGSRRAIYPADVRGPTTRWRRFTFAALLAVLLAVPWIQINGRPAILLDIPHRQFFLLGEVFNAQDTFLLFFLLTGVGFALVVTTSLFGRMWCGFACPQTVVVDGLFRSIERLIEGSRDARIKLDRAPLSVGKVARRVTKHLLYIALSLILAHTLLGYFFPIRTMASLLAQGPAQHLEAFLWTMGFAAIVYFDGAFFREQFCVIMCPYGRLQSVLTDRHSIVVGYDVKRGEPRGKLKVLGNGDCVDCKRCIQVCPTGIDIRQGLQLDCIGCAACIDACDEVMLKIDKPKGLIRFDSEEGFQGGKTQLLRPRTLVYAVAALAGLLAFGTALHLRRPFEASLLRPRGAPYTLEAGEIRNVLRLRLTSKRAEPTTFLITPVDPPPGLSLIVAQPQVTVPPHGNIEVPIIASRPSSAPRTPATIQLSISQDKSSRSVSVPFLSPP